MILELAARGRKTIAIVILTLLYVETVLPAYAWEVTGRAVSVPAVKNGNLRPAGALHMRHGGEAVKGERLTPVSQPVAATASKRNTTDVMDIGGPGQPESQSFSSVNNSNMVDLFSGDFSYNIPLLDVDGYPVTIGYNSGISMDQEASWVGLGWNINPGSITRNMRGLPDDFNGVDTIQRVTSIKDNKTIGVSAGADLEIVGFPVTPGIGAGLGVVHNSYRGWGIEQSFNTSINAGSSSMGMFTAGLSVTNSSQEGLTLGNSLSWSMTEQMAKDNGGLGGSLSTGVSYNTRTGLKALSFSAGLRQYVTDQKNSDETKKNADDKTGTKSAGSVFSSYLSFAYPSFTPATGLPYTSTLFNFTAKVGGLVKVVHPSFFVSGYVAKQYIADEDKRLSYPAYGYLNYQNANRNAGALLDFNREKDIPYREKPPVPHIAVPSYTYDLFSVSGEGTGGMFRAYRGDIGYVHDPVMKTRDKSAKLSLDLGLGDIVHGGVDLNLTRSFTQTGPWKEQNPLASTLAFRQSAGVFEAAYFRNPGEKAVNTKSFYDAIGGDDVVAVNLYQPGNSGPSITTTNYLNRYRNKRAAGQAALTVANAYKTVRDKRTQVISYLTAAEASEVGLSRYIENYPLNRYSTENCKAEFPDVLGGPGNGLKGEFFKGRSFEQKLFERIDNTINFDNVDQINQGSPAGAPRLGENFSARWTGRLKVPVTGRYKLGSLSDDGVRLYLNDTMIIDHWNLHSRAADQAVVYLVAGQIIDLKLEYYNGPTDVVMRLQWEYISHPIADIPKDVLYATPPADTFATAALSREKRVNTFRKPHHISEIDVLNPDGRKYVYGLPVYNLRQREATFSVDARRARSSEGTAGYTAGIDDTPNNKQGKDNYYSSELLPPYAHSFLLTGIVSPDYTDLSGDGISDDDPGVAVRFNYTKVAGIKNPYSWRAPYSDSVTYNEGLKSDWRDDKGSYVYGEKELWYLHSISSKNMIATFKLTDREDQPAISENGIRKPGKVLKKLEEINLYAKADFQRYNTAARPIKTVHFEYNYELCRGANGPGNNNGKLTLKRIWFTYNGKKDTLNPYVFNYHANNPAYNAKAYDRWGNYKDAQKNPGSVAGNIVTNAEYPYALQDSTVAAANAAAWTLDSIALPSGGRIKISYESDDYAYVQNRRAAQMFRIAGFSASEPSAAGSLVPQLYGTGGDFLYVGIHVPKPVKSRQEVYAYYLEGMEKIYFRLNVQMPADKWGSGNEYVPCYAAIEEGGYGFFNNGNSIWLKLRPIDNGGRTGNAKSIYSPLAKAAIQFLRLNLPSKAYPGSDVGDDIDLGDGVKMLLSQADNVINSLKTYDNTARSNQWARQVDLSRTLVRLNNPFLKKFGGGLRVKSIRIYDHWNAMTKQKESVYGQEYQYTTTKEVNGIPVTISSGVASYEPTLGGDENPWRLPVEYTEQIAPLAPVTLGYTEEPLGESFYPSPSVGYSKVRVRSINTKNTRSANGYEETCFYTTYDFPVITDMTMLADSKKRFKPSLANFLRINARHFMAVSQGFKVELNDMNGKLKSQGTYPETDAENPIAFTAYYYRVDNDNVPFKHLNNTVMAINPQGVIDPEATLGKDVELMMDMREQRSVTNATNPNINGDLFTLAVFPGFLASFFSLAQREETIFRSAGTTKIINRHGLVDSIVSIDKGSRITTQNLLYDTETGDVLLTSAQNEFNDPIYHFTYPAGWMYDGMSSASKNINAIAEHLTIRSGKITAGLSAAAVPVYFSAGDEILATSREKVTGTDCAPSNATFPSVSSIYAVDANTMNGGAPDIYFMDRDGKPFNGYDVTLKVIHSGRKNMSATVGEVTLMKNPVVKSGSTYSLVFDNTSRVLAATVTEFKQFWKVADKKKAGVVTSCVEKPYAQYAGAGACGIVNYSNREISRTFTKSNCGTGYIGTPVNYTVFAGTYTSTISQADADAQAEADIARNGQGYANTNGGCNRIYYSAAASKPFTKDDCATGGVPSTLVYSVAAGKYLSTISQADADAKAQADINANGQKYANDNGTCTFSNVQKSQVFTRNNCGTGGVAGTATYVVPAGRYTSTISQADADAKAQADINANGQEYANNNASCTYTYYNVQKSQVFTRNNCGAGGVGGTATYTVPAGRYTSTISQADADAKAQADINANGQKYANDNATCTFSNVQKSQVFTRNNCGTGGVGGTATYTVPAGRYTSTISQADADAKAQADINANGQEYVNHNAICTYSNVYKSGTFYRNDCPPGTITYKKIYEVPAGTYTSTISQADADAKAQADIDANGQDYANRYGVCEPVIPYARIEYTDVVTSPTNVVRRRASVHIRFYWDEECTTPFPAYNIVVKYDIARTECPDLNPGVSHRTVTCSGPSTQIATNEVLEYDKGDGINCFTVEYRLVSSAAYHIVIGQ